MLLLQCLDCRFQVPPVSAHQNLLLALFFLLHFLQLAEQFRYPLDIADVLSFCLLDLQQEAFPLRLLNTPLLLPLPSPLPQFQLADQLVLLFHQQLHSLYDGILLTKHLRQRVYLLLQHCVFQHQLLLLLPHQR